MYYKASQAYKSHKQLEDVTRLLKAGHKPTANL